MIQESDLIVYPHEELRDKAALYISKQRLVFEYPRDGYGVYNEGHILNIKNGYLGEFAFLEFVISKFKSEFGNDKDFWDKVKKKYKFSYNPVVGNYDKGFEFLINEKSIDIKMYGTKKVSREQIFNGLEKDFKATIDGAVPLYATCTMLTPAMALNNSGARWNEDPIAGVE